MENNELVHWGIKGMKWGRRRYQNKDGTWTAEGKARRRDDDGNDDDPNESIEDKKQRILRSKSAEEIYKNSHLFNDQEIGNAANRLANEKRIREMIPPKPPSMKEKLAASIKTTLVPPLMESGKKALTKYIEDKLGLKEQESPLKVLTDASKAVTTANQLKTQFGFDVTETLTNALKKKGVSGTKIKNESKETDNSESDNTKETKTSSKEGQTEAKHQEKARENMAKTMTYPFNSNNVKQLAEKGKSSVEEFLYTDKYKNPDGTWTYVYDPKGG